MKNKVNRSQRLEDILLSEIPSRRYLNILIINGEYKLKFRKKFEQNLKKINILNKNSSKYVKPGIEGGIVRLLTSLELKEGKNLSLGKKYDLIVISSVLYQKYIGQSLNLIYYCVDTLLDSKGVLVTVHEQELYLARFPYLLLQSCYLNNQNIQFVLEVYTK